MTFDLRLERWIPFRRVSGAIEWGPPSLLTEGVMGGDPIVSVSWTRPDFDGAIQEFLIGLLSVALAPADEDEWLERWHTPPTPDELRAVLAALPPAFYLDGDGPRAFQDLAADAFADCTPSPIAQLLIDAPGDQGIRQNKDLFVKRERVGVLSRAAAAMTLVTMQTYAPAGGAGNRTSLRGGGPLTTLVDPRPLDGPVPMQALWYLVWANVETVEQREERAGGRAGAAGRAPDAGVFPWLAPTRHSDPKNGGAPTTPRDADPLQAYFGLPRRLRLEVGGAGHCDLTGLEDSATVTGFRQRPWGAQYQGWHHPLTPHYESKEGWLPLHGQSEGVVWRDWLGLLVANAVQGRRPARSVAHFLARRARRVGCHEPSVRAFGYDMDNMKARGWVEARLPAFALDDAELRERVAALAGRLVEATESAAYHLLQAVKGALFGGADAPGDLSHVKQALWHATEAPFHASVRALVGGTPATTLQGDFRGTLEREGLRLFDGFAGTEATAPDAMKRLVGARYSLVLTLRGHGKSGQKLFTALALPLPGDASVPATRASARTPAPKANKGSRTRAATPHTPGSA